MINAIKRFEIFKRDDFTCRYCGAKPPSVQIEIDHVIPRSAGGSDDEGNLVTACWDCNAGKGARALDLDAMQTALSKDRDIAPWMSEATPEEMRRYGVLENQIEMLEIDMGRDVAERRKIMRRAIARMRRKEGKE